jgi:uncharacterized protein (TIGR02391 family)
MPRRDAIEPRRPANLSADQINAALPKLQRRIDELKEVKFGHWSDELRDRLDVLQKKVDQTLESIFPRGTSEYDRYRVLSFDHNVPYSMGFEDDRGEEARGYSEAVKRAILTLETVTSILNEQLGDMGASPGATAVRAYEGLDLHPSIKRRVDRLYRDGHYAHAVADAVKALRDLVRAASGRDDLDGVPLMQTVFSAKSPVLRFNDLKDQADQDEQVGFMWLFSGAMMGLRNPRAHSFINDDAERALEFIAFVSLLAKLLDRAGD